MYEKFRCTNILKKKDGAETKCNWFLLSLTSAGVSVICPNCKAKHIIYFDKRQNKLRSALYDGHLIFPIKENKNGSDSLCRLSGGVKCE